MYLHIYLFQILFQYCSQYLLGIISIKYMNFKVFYVKVCFIHTIKIYLGKVFLLYTFIFFFQLNFSSFLCQCGQWLQVWLIMLWMHILCIDSHRARISAAEEHFNIWEYCTQQIICAGCLWAQLKPRVIILCR